MAANRVGQSTSWPCQRDGAQEGSSDDITDGASIESKSDTGVQESPVAVTVLATDKHVGHGLIEITPRGVPGRQLGHTGKFSPTMYAFE
jgi:hypothetical protein